MTQDEQRAEAAYLRSVRTLSEADVDRATAKHDRDDIPAEVRWTAVAH